MCVCRQRLGGSECVRLNLISVLYYIKESILWLTHSRRVSLCIQCIIWESVMLGASDRFRLLS